MKPKFQGLRLRLPPTFKLWPDMSQAVDLRVPLIEPRAPAVEVSPWRAASPEALAFPETPPIPPIVASGDLITAVHENTVTEGISDLWVDLQWLAASSLTNPTTVKGDLIVNDGSAVARLPVGANAQVLTADSTVPLGVKWATPTASGSFVPTSRRVNAGAGMTGGGALTADVTLNANVTSVFGRTGDVALGAGDIAAAGGTVSVFGRSGTVTAQPGDYTAAQVTNAVSTLGAYADPAWITSFAWGKITGAPATFPPSAHTHDASAIVSGIIATARLGSGAADGTVFLRGDGTWAAPTGGGGSGSQTPWTSDIDAARFTLYNTGKIGIGVTPASSVLMPLQVEGGRSWFRPASEPYAIYVAYNNVTPGYYIGATSDRSLVFSDSAGAERVRITDSGNVGIGQSVPTNAKLEVISGATPTDFALSGAGSFRIATDPWVSAPALLFGLDGAIQSAWIQAIQAGSATNVLLLNPRGSNVGIGSTSASEALSVFRPSGVQTALYLWQSGVASSTLGSKANDTSFYITNSYYGSVLGDATHSITLTRDGAVGVQTATPSYALDCAGTMGFRSQLFGDGRLVLTTNDSYLRINQGNEFSSGIWLGASPLRMQFGHLLVGSQGGPGAIDISATAGDAVQRVTIDGNNGGFQTFSTGGGVRIGTQSGSDALVIAGFGPGGMAHLRMIYSGYGCLFRSDGSRLYCMVTANGDPYGGWTTPIPWSFDLATKNMVINQLNVDTTFLSKGLLQSTGKMWACSDLVQADFGGAALQVRETNQAGAASNGDNNYAPRISFHWGGVVASQIGVDNSGAIRTFDNPGTGYAPFKCGMLVVNSYVGGSLGLRVGVYGFTATPGDLGVARDSDPSTGAIYFGSAGTAYIYYGANTIQFSKGISAGGNVNITGQYQINGVPISTGGGGPTTQVVATGSRSIGSVYQNGAKPLFVAVTCQCNPGGNGFAAYTDANGNPGQQVAYVTNTGSVTNLATLSFWVMPGNYFKILQVGSGSSISSWIEWY